MSVEGIVEQIIEEYFDFSEEGHDVHCSDWWLGAALSAGREYGCNNRVLMMIVRDINKFLKRHDKESCFRLRIGKENKDGN